MQQETITFPNKISEVNTSQDLPKFKMVGVIKKIFEPISKTEKFSYQEFILSITGNFKQDYKFMCVNTRIPQLLKTKVGDIVEISFNLYGREFEKDGELVYGEIKGQVYQINVLS